MAVGDVLIGYPTHICPTVALHARATVVRGGIATGETWAVSARDR
jgi:D-serine deaminase-like pyridoxal phosphate-dependent protein